MGRLPQIKREPTAIGRNLKRLRKALGLAQEALAERAGLTRPTISEIETGTTAPTSVTLEVLAKALGVRVSELTDDAAVDGPMSAAVDAYLADPWAKVDKATPEELAWLRSIRGENLFGFGPSGPSPKAIHHLLEAIRSEPK